MSCVFKLSVLNLRSTPTTVGHQEALSWLRLKKPFQLHFASSFPKCPCASTFLSQCLPGREMRLTSSMSLYKVPYNHEVVSFFSSLPWVCTLDHWLLKGWGLAADVYITSSSLGLGFKTDMSPWQPGIEVVLQFLFFFLTAFLPIWSHVFQNYG